MSKKPGVMVISLLLFCSTWATTAGEPGTLSDLLQQVKSSRTEQDLLLNEREAEFSARRKDQRQLLNDIESKLQAEQQNSEQLGLAFRDNGTELEELQAELAKSREVLGEVFGVIRQAAAEAHAVQGGSLIALDGQERLSLLDELSSSRRLPTIDQLESLWFALLEETTASGRVDQFKAPVITAAGSEQLKRITRVGAFNAIADGKYLRFLPETQRLVEINRQPPARFLAMAQAFEQTSQGLAPLAVDPSRGAILALMVQSPTLPERIAQGGILGYIILLLGLLGILVVGERLLVLGWTGRKMRRQIASDAPSTDNPLGRLLSVAARVSRNADAGVLTHRLEEALLKELPGIRRGLPLLAVLAGIAPLLGLLGTVAGMIETFQSITLFGTGDPKLMSGGISQALVTTELGLVVAIPLVLLRSLIAARSNALIQILDEQSSALKATRLEQNNAAAA